MAATLNGLGNAVNINDALLKIRILLAIRAIESPRLQARVAGAI